MEDLFKALQTLADYRLIYRYRGQNEIKFVMVMGFIVNKQDLEKLLQNVDGLEIIPHSNGCTFIFKFKNGEGI